MCVSVAMQIQGIGIGTSVIQRKRGFALFSLDMTCRRVTTTENKDLKTGYIKMYNSLYRILRKDVLRQFTIKCIFLCLDIL